MAKNKSGLSAKSAAASAWRYVAKMAEVTKISKAKSGVACGESVSRNQLAAESNLTGGGSGRLSMAWRAGLKAANLWRRGGIGASNHVMKIMWQQ